jgi:hypothetical protein
MRVCGALMRRLLRLCFAATVFVLIGLATTPSGSAQSATCSAGGSCTFQFSNGISLTLTPIAGSGNTFSFSFTGPTFSLTGTATETASFFNFTGTEVVGGTSSAINCTVFTNGTFSGTCGVLFGGSVGAPVAVAGAANGSTRSQVETTVEILSNRIQAISRDVALGKSAANQFGNYSGISAGDAATNWGVWFDGSGSYLSNNSSIAAYEGYGTTGLGGVDYIYNNAWLLGWDAGYARTDVLIKALGGNRIANAAQTGPYVSYIFNKHVTADASIIYAHVFNTLSAGPQSSDFNSNRIATSINLNVFGTNEFGFLFTGAIGWTYAYEAPSTTAPNTIGGVPTTIHYSAISVGGEIAHDFGNFEPYVPVKLSQETTETRDGTGQFGVESGVGLRYHWNDQLTIGAQATAEIRNHSETALGSVNIRFVF